jgi:predicted Zn-dependent peptidase
VVTVEPPQRGERRLTLDDPSQPFLVIGYHRPSVMSPDDATYDAISDVLGGGRSSRLYKSLVKEKKLAVAAGCSATVEGEKYPGIFLFYAVPNQGKTNTECEAAIYEQIEKLQSEPITAEEMEGIKARAKSRFLDSIKSNMGLAMGLAMAQNIEGDWREAFRGLEKIDKVTAADIQRVAKETFTKQNRTVGSIETAGGQQPEEN